MLSILVHLSSSPFRLQDQFASHHTVSYQKPIGAHLALHGISILRLHHLPAERLTRRRSSLFLLISRLLGMSITLPYHLLANSLTRLVSHPALSGVGSVGLSARSSLKTHHLTPTPQCLEATLSYIAYMYLRPKPENLV
jgi:hypothetical protein